MTILIVVLFLFLNVFNLNAQTQNHTQAQAQPVSASSSEISEESSEMKPLYQLPSKLPVLKDKDSKLSVFIAGGEAGLFKVSSSNNYFPLWTDGSVDQILQCVLPDEKGNPQNTWIFRTSKGVIFTQDLENFEERNNGLAFLTIKKYINKETSLVKQIQELKDIGINPVNPMEMVTATKDNVYFTSDAGLNWRKLPSVNQSTTGVKAVAAATINGETVVFVNHPINGLFYTYPNRKGALWEKITGGLEIMSSLTSPDEIADILPVVRTQADGSVYTEIYLSQSFLPCLYRLDWNKKRAEMIYRGTEPAGTIDGLTSIDNVILFTTMEGFGSLDIQSLTSPGNPAKLSEWKDAFEKMPGMISCAWIPSGRSGFGKGVLLNELWLLYPGTIDSPYAASAVGKKCIYASAYQCRLQAGIDKYIKLVKDRNMNGLVIDMKDDYGLLRYDSKNPEILAKGKITQYAVDLDHFISEFKKENIYLVARIVTFKDRALSNYAGGKYAVWDAVLNKPWVGTKGMEDVEDENGNPTGERAMAYYDENWVDPYSEEVWEYNILVAKELIERGFDEIQFDYIRFPTDGLNLDNARFRWKSPGMDKESALISFLSYARENIKAPIGIDIYGANGWYRTGARTGQDSEMLAHYVDVIGPMFYPSHFEQSFLNYAPYSERTYRIYYYGSYRNTVLCRNRAIVRPWIQSFKLNVSYDRTYYNSDYIKKEFYGTKDALDRGYMCWNNSGDYSVTPADNTATEPYDGPAKEALETVKHPAFGKTEKASPVESDLSILDTVVENDEDKFKNKRYIPFLKVR